MLDIVEFVANVLTLGGGGGGGGERRSWRYRAVQLSLLLVPGFFAVVELSQSGNVYDAGVAFFTAAVLLAFLWFALWLVFVVVRWLARLVR